MNNIVEFYPNPANHEFFLKSIEPAQYNLLDLEGRIMLRGRALPGTTRVSLDGPIQIPSGLYTIQLEGNYSFCTNKVIIKRL
jgi:hypothetical protein